MNWQDHSLPGKLKFAELNPGYPGFSAPQEIVKDRKKNPGIFCDTDGHEP